MRYVVRLAPSGWVVLSAVKGGVNVTDDIDKAWRCSKGCADALVLKLRRLYPEHEVSAEPAPSIP